MHLFTSYETNSDQHLRLELTEKTKSILFNVIWLVGIDVDLYECNSVGVWWKPYQSTKVTYRMAPNIREMIFS